MRRSFVCIGRFVVVAAALLVCVVAAGPRAAAGLAQGMASPVAASGITLSGMVVHPGPVSVADLQQLPTETVKVMFQAGGAAETHTFTGVRLWDVLQQAGLVTAPDEKNPTLTRYLVVTANDGYQVVVSVGEIDPNFGHAPLLLAWAQDGQPLTGANGPLRLVVPGDVKGGRYVHGIVSIDVRSARAAGTSVATPAA